MRPAPLASRTRRGRPARRAAGAVPAAQRGVALIEALIGLMVLAIGVLGSLYFQGFMVSSNTVSTQRMEAAMLAQELIAMASSDVDNVGCYATAGGGGCGSAQAGTYLADWLARATARLPGASANPPTAVLQADGVYTVTLFWIQKDGGTTRNHRVATQIGG